MDENLVELVARALHDAAQTLPETSQGARIIRSHRMHFARAALAAINASDTHWVAPWKMTGPMHNAYNIAFKNGCSAGSFWAGLRDAYLPYDGSPEAMQDG